MDLSIREIQFESLRILKLIDSISKKENLHYTLHFGSLLGAIRHKGFIPWDDDLDIAMLRPDYEKLKNYFIEHKNELKPFEFFSPETRSNYPYMLGRVVNTSFKMVSESEPDFGMGTFVDVYAFDGAGNGRHQIVYYLSCFLTTLYGLKNKIYFVKPFGKLRSFFKRILFYLCRLFSYKFLQKNLYALASRYSLIDSEYVACLTWMDGGKPLVFNSDFFKETIMIDFEDGKYPVPKNYDAILRKLYGDYMVLPPENERIGHHYYKILSGDEVI